MKKTYLRPLVRTTGNIEGQILAGSIDPTLSQDNTTSGNGINSADAKPGYDW